MRSLRSVLGHPVTLVAFAFAAGLAIHEMTQPGPAPAGDAAAARTSRTLPAAADAGAPPGDAAATEAAGAGAGDVDAASRAAADAPPAPPADPADGAAPAPQEAPAETPRVVTPPAVDASLEPVAFREVWAYLMAGEDARWSPAAGVTDVGLFNFGLGDDGSVTGTIKESTLALVRQRGARAHLVIASSGQKSLLHFLLNPNFRAQGRFLAEILRLVKRYPADGLQLDFESMLPEDRLHFLAFIRSLRAELPPGCIFSLALPARDAVRADDPLRYRGLDHLADRYFIMVYDEHWRGGGPGSIASGQWHDRIVEHALAELPRDRVVIGLPFYGRIWQIDTVARATRFSDIGEILAGENVDVVYDVDKSHRFTFEQKVRAEGWFEDAATLRRKFAAAKARGAAAIGFWRLGQEDARVWSLLRVEK